MMYFAELNTNNIVIDVVTVNDENILDENGNESEAVGISFLKKTFGENKNWKQTSYSGTIRKNYAGIGYTYDSIRDAFISPIPYDGCLLDETTCKWIITDNDKFN